LNPAAVLKRGYAVIRNQQGATNTRAYIPDLGDSLRIELYRAFVEAKITAVQIKKKTSEG